MKKWNLVAETAAPDGTSVSLLEHDGDYAIRVGSAQLMSTRGHASEERLAELACAGLKTKRDARVLIGGLGLGFTLRATLGSLARHARVEVAEILQAVIEWNRNPAYPLAGDAMQDRRVAILHEDVFAVMNGARRSFDAILLDVDNGPAALTAPGNARIYSEGGLRLIRTALKPGGCAAFWSASSDPAFEKALARAGFKVQAHRCRSHPTSGPWHTILVGSLPPPGSPR